MFIPILIFPDFIIIVFFEAKIIFFSSAVLKPVVPITCTILFFDASSTCFMVTFGNVKSITTSALEKMCSILSVMSIPIFLDLIILPTSIPRYLLLLASVAPTSLSDLSDIIFFKIVCPILPEAPTTITFIGFMI